MYAKPDDGCMHAGFKIEHEYTVGHPLGRDVLLCFLSEVPVTNWAAQYLLYQPNGQRNISQRFYKISRLKHT